MTHSTVTPASAEAVRHREEEYDSRGFQLMKDMQDRHFWYRGRHRFLLHAVRRHLPRLPSGVASCRAVDLGGGCGGWLTYLLRHGNLPLGELALADSSELALRLAREQLPAHVRGYQVDLLRLPWRGRWDAVFLLDVLEHIPQHEEALREIAAALAPGGLLFLTCPALSCFWTWNDEVAEHQRRYSRADLRQLAAACGCELLDARYFMFFLSPLLLAARLGRRPRLDALSDEEAWELMKQTHRVPPGPINAALGAVFACETPLGHVVRFPWGTSILGVFQKARE